jgi:thymidine phosphorylase
MNPPRLRALRMGIDTHQEYVVYMRRDCVVCRAEGFRSSSRVAVCNGDQTLVATLNVVDNDRLDPGAIGLSNALWEQMQPVETVTVSHAPVVTSMSAVRAKIFGHRLNDAAMESIIRDIARGYYSDVQIAGFLSACAGNRLSPHEITTLTRVMIDVGERLDWGAAKRVYDKHCIGGLPGNRTTPLIVAIASAAGLVMPKTSSRAITSPAGTADTMATITRVALDRDAIRRTVESTGACLAWGGGFGISPVDDLLIRIERALDLDSEGQLVASVLSKKIAAGSTDVLIDIPIGDTAKVRNKDDAERLQRLFVHVGDALGIRVQCLITDGSQPIGRGIGPALEARDILAVFRNERDAPADLREKSLILSAHLLAMARGMPLDTARCEAEQLLQSGAALAQFERICRAQGEWREPPLAPHRETLFAQRDGIVSGIDNRRIARLAKLAGAPEDPAAGVELHCHVGDHRRAGEPLLTVHSESAGELEYALAFYRANTDMITTNGTPGQLPRG